MRDEFAVVTRPKLVVSFTLSSTEPNCVWLKALKNSERKINVVDSVTLVAFCTLISQLLMPGPWKKRRLALPSRPIGSGANKDVLKYGPLRGFEIFREPGVYSGVSSGSWIGPEPEVPKRELSSISSSVTGRPVEKRVTALTVQPFVSRFEASM